MGARYPIPGGRFDCVFAPFHPCYRSPTVRGLRFVFLKRVSYNHLAISWRPDSGCAIISHRLNMLEKRRDLRGLLRTMRVTFRGSNCMVRRTVPPKALAQTRKEPRSAAILGYGLTAGGS